MSRSTASRLVLVALFVSSCTSTVDTTTSTTLAPVTTVTSTPAATTTAPSVMEPADDATRSIDDQLGWFIGLLNGADVTEDEYEARFAQVFIDQVGYGDFTSLLDQIIAGTSGWSVVGTEQRTDANLSVLIAPTGGEPTLRVLLNIDAESRIDGLFLQPAEPPVLDDPPGSFEEAFERIAALGTAGVLVAETTDGGCVPVAETRTETALPIGSMFKLYVLGAVADAIAAGAVDWSDSVTLSVESFSLPSGITQDEEPGSTVGVMELAQRMIAISDNTATDHLIGLVGRDAVEAIQVDMGHADPSLNRPFLTTGELFKLKLGDPTLLDAFVAADTDGRRLVLAELAAVPLPDLGTAVGFTEPVAPLEAEWFASPLDLCRAWLSLAERSGEPRLEPLASIVGTNPGIPDETGAWDEIWFKGGSEPGVLGMSWYLTAGDRSFVVAGSVASEDESLDETEVVLLFGAVRDLLAAEVAG